MGQKQRETGFTIIELLVVVVVVGIIASTGVYGYKSYAGSTGLKASAKQLAGDLWMARQRAIASSVPHAVRFEMDGNRYRIFRDDGPGAEWGNGELNEGAGEVVVRDRELGDAYFIYYVDLDPSDVVIYYPKGTLKNGTTGGSVTVADSEHKTRTVSIIASGLTRVD